MPFSLSFSHSFLLRFWVTNHFAIGRLKNDEGSKNLPRHKFRMESHDIKRQLGKKIFDDNFLGKNLSSSFLAFSFLGENLCPQMFVRPFEGLVHSLLLRVVLWHLSVKKGLFLFREFVRKTWRKTAEKRIFIIKREFETSSLFVGLSSLERPEENKTRSEVKEEADRRSAKWHSFPHFLSVHILQTQC